MIEHRISEENQEILDRFQSYRLDPWKFLSECVYTLDQVDEDNPIKPYPSDLAYLKFVVRCWQREKLLAIPKSRRMTVSWTFIALALWDVLFRKGKSWAFVSQKELAAEELVSRAEFIYKNIPESKIPRELLPRIKGGKMTTKPPKLEFPEINSYIQGFPMGNDQLRQYTFSGIFGDECAFWSAGQKFYAAAKPTTDGGGRLCLVSSRAPSFFKKVVFDQLDSKTLTFPEKAPSKVHKPLQGLEVWKNPKNQFLIIDIHYTAHPQRRSKAYRDFIRQTVPLREYLMEYEKSWETFVGKPVYHDFNPNFHIAREIPLPILGVPMFLGFDFGLTPAAVLLQFQNGILYCMREWVAEDEGIKTFAPRVEHDLLTLYPEFNDPNNYLIFVDPAGFDRKDTDARTCVQIIKDETNFRKIYPGPVDFMSRTRAVEFHLLKMTKNGPMLQIDEMLCPVLVGGFKGGYRYPDKALDIEPSKLRPLKDRFSHPHDALQYACAGVILARKTKSIDIPNPSYSFLKQPIAVPTDHSIYQGDATWKIPLNS